jgi:hypothetical protein
MTVDRTRRLWLLDMNAHVRAMHAHEVAARLFERIGDSTCAALASERAVSERMAYTDTAAEHPEWSVDVSFGLTDVHRADAGAQTQPLGPGDR